MILDIINIEDSKVFGEYTVERVDHSNFVVFKEGHITYAGNYYEVANYLSFAELPETTEMQKELFDRCVSMGYRINNLRGIVQNQGYYPTRKQLQEWVGQVDESIQMLQKLKEDVVAFCERRLD